MNGGPSDFRLGRGKGCVGVRCDLLAKDLDVRGLEMYFEVGCV